MSDNFEITPWMIRNFTEREIKEMEFCYLYAKKFSHGTDGHNVRLIVSRLTMLLNNVHFRHILEDYSINFDDMMGYNLEAQE
jgi:hypothetical protein